MIKILLVEDNNIKAEKVINLINEEVKPDSFWITHSTNIKDAKSSLYETRFDLIILDLVLPLEGDDIDPKAEKGVQFLDEIYENPSINIPIHIIGLTAVEGLKEQYEQRFHKNLNHLINYEEEAVDWKDQLKNFVWRLIEKEDEFFSNRSLQYVYDVAFITATDKELAGVIELSTDWESITVENDASVYKKTVFTGSGDRVIRIIAASAPEMGMNASATLTMKLIENFRPRYIIMTGISASVKSTDTHGFGDIIVADETWDGGAGKITQDEDSNAVFKPSARHLRLDPDTKENIRSIKESPWLASIREQCTCQKPNTVLQCHIGPVASVAGVIENAAVVEELRLQDRKLEGIEMETYGVFYSANNCSNPKPIPISLKSISDFATTDKVDLYQPYASHTSAQFAYRLIIDKLFGS